MLTLRRNHLLLPLLLFKENNHVYNCIALCTFHVLYIVIQMWELFNILPLIIGKRMTLEDPHFACFFMLLNDIATVVLSPIISSEQIPFLRLQYLEQFASLYPQRPLTPKLHYLLHIPSLIKRYTWQDHK